jgi:uncharacterized protein YdaL
MRLSNLKSNKKLSLLRWGLLAIISINSSGAISATSNTAGSKQYTLVIRAGLPLGHHGRKEDGGDWKASEVIKEERDKKAGKSDGAALGALSNSAYEITTEDKEKSKHVQRVAKRVKKSKLLTTASGLAPIMAAATVASPTPNTLILYDYRPADTFGKLGKAYAIMLRNLLGHFNANVTLVPISDYVAGSVNNYDATFYLGTYFGNAVNTAFLQDAKTTTRKVVWFKYNLDQLTQWGDQSGSFAQQFGFYFNGLQGMNASPTAANPAPGFYDTVLYKNKALSKFYAFDASSNTILADYDAGQTTISNATLAKSLVTIQNAKTGATMPYVVQANNFWYFADSPFSYIGPRDRYLVFADILHDILGVTHAEQHRAMVRLEDMSYLVVRSTVTTLANYFYGTPLNTVHPPKIPFSMAVVPHYVDAFGAFNNGVPLEVAFSGATTLRNAINDGLNRGGKVVMHGDTHQFGTLAQGNRIKNPNSGVSADDFEFWDLSDRDGNSATFDPKNTPIQGETTATVLARIDAGRAELVNAGAKYTPFVWETPHYQGSPVAYRAIAQRFPNAYERAVYYTSETPDLSSANPTRDIAAGQFFPYVIEKDYYGRKVLPENLGNIEYNICAVDASSCLNYTWQDLSLNANYALVVRDGFASFFFHPFWLETFPASYNVRGFADLQSLVNSINTLGYTWVGADTL